MPAFLIRAAVRLYALILRFYPAPFRERCGAPMVATFEQVCRTRAEQRGLGAFLGHCLGEYMDAIAGIRRSHRSERSLPPLPYGNPASDSLGFRLLQDVRYAIKRLRAQPTLLLFTVLTLGFAIAANAAIFSVVDAVLLRPSPYTDADRLMNLLNKSARTGILSPGLSREKLRHWRTETDIFETVEAYRPTSVIVTGGLEPEEVRAAHMSPGLLVTLGVAPKYGRLFTPEEARAGLNTALVVSERFWRSHLGGDPAAVGRTLFVNGRAHTVVGIMPDRFHFPTLREQVWLPLDPEARPAAGAAAANTLVRLKAGLTPETARQRIDAAVARLDAERPLPSGWNIVLRRGALTGADERTQRTVLILLGAVALVLLTACANVANVLLSRAIDRQREFAIRLVLGASRWRLFRELLIEGLLLGLAAGAVGLLAASWAVESLVKLAPPELMSATTTNIAVDGRALLFGLAVSVLTGVLCNLPPALRTMRAQGNEALSGRSRTSTSTPVQRRLRAGLVVIEISLAVVLLVGTALMVRSFMKLNAIDIGYNPEKLVALTIGLDSSRYASESARIAFLRQVAADVEELPGVSGVAAASGLPPSPGTLGLATMASDAGACGEEHTPITANLVTPSYFGLMGITIVEGRTLREDDPPDAVVVSRALARLCGTDSLAGKRLRLDTSAPPVQVVGVAADVKTRGLLSDDGDVAIYMSFAADPAVLPMTAMMMERRVVARRLIVRAERPATITGEVKRLLWARDPDQPVLHAAPVSELMGESIRRERFILALMTLFSAVALSLASAGIFGVLAYAVAQRTTEIGIRMALGASAAEIRKLVVGHGVALAALGICGGLAGAFALSRVLAGLLYEINPRDPVVFIVAPLLVLIVALLASWIPTARALKVDPASALRVE